MRAKVRACHLLLAAISLWLVACATTPEGQVSPADLQRNGELDAWQLRGKIGFRSPEQSRSAYLNWQQCQQHFDIRLSGQLGQGAARLQGDGQQAVLTDSDGASRSGSDAGILLLDQTGWTIPVTEMRYWLRGIPQPGQRHRRRDGANFSQSGWQLEFSKWQQSGAHTLPGRIMAHHEQLDITLVISQWQLNPVCQPASDDA